MVYACRVNRCRVVGGNEALWLDRIDPVGQTGNRKSLICVLLSCDLRIDSTLQKLWAKTSPKREIVSVIRLDHNRACSSLDCIVLFSSSIAIKQRSRISSRAPVRCCLNLSVEVSRLLLFDSMPNLRIFEPAKSMDIIRIPEEFTSRLTIDPISI